MSERITNQFCEACNQNTPHLTSGSGRKSTCEYCSRLNNAVIQVVHDSDGFVAFEFNSWKDYAEAFPKGILESGWSRVIKSSR